MHHHETGGVAVWAWWLVMGVASLVYLTLAYRQRRDRRGWSGWRTLGFVTGTAMVAVAMAPALLPYGAGDFRQHMVQHLMVGMIAPTPLVLAAPLTLVLRSVSAIRGRWLVRVIRSRPLRVLAHPAVALALNLGGMAALYFSPLYVAMAHHGWLHHAVHVHFFAAGCLFAWVIAGPDPAPHRPTVPIRLVVLGVAIAIHATLSQMLYAGAFVAIPLDARELQGGAALMYYGGDFAELLLAFALVSSWRPRRRHLARVEASKEGGDVPMLGPRA